MPRTARRLLEALGFAAGFVVSIALFLTLVMGGSWGWPPDAPDVAIATDPTTAVATVSPAPAAPAVASTRPPAPPTATPRPPVLVPASEPSAPLRSGGPAGPTRASDLRISRFVSPDVGCWEATREDARGHQTGGTVVDLAVSIANKGAEPADQVWIIVESIGRVATFPVVDGFEPGRAARFRYGSDGVALRVAPIKPGRTVRLRWSVVFGTPLDVTYRVSVVRAASFKDAKRAYEAGELERTWKASTRSDDC